LLESSRSKIELSESLEGARCDLEHICKWPCSTGVDCDCITRNPTTSKKTTNMSAERKQADIGGVQAKANRKKRTLPVIEEHSVAVFSNVAHSVKRVKVVDTAVFQLPQTVLPDTVLVTEPQVDGTFSMVRHIPQAPKEEARRPPYLMLSAGPDGKGKLYDISYMSKGQEWKPIYHLFVSDVDAAVKLVCTAQIDNSSSEVLDTTSTELVAGEINIEATQYPRRVTESRSRGYPAAAAAASAYPSGDLECFADGDDDAQVTAQEGELTKYDIGPLMLKDVTNVDLFTLDNPQGIDKTFYVQLDRTTSRVGTVPYGFRVVPTQILAGGIVSVYRMGKGERASALAGAIGEARIGDSPAGIPLDLKLGKSNELSAAISFSSKVVGEKIISEDHLTVKKEVLIEYTYELEFVNRATTKATIVLAFEVGHAKPINATNLGFRKVGRTLEWTVEVPPPTREKESTTHTLAVTLQTTIETRKNNGGRVGAGLVFE